MKTAMIVLSLMFALPSVGSACVNGVRIDTDMVVKAIAKAEGQLAIGKYAAVLHTLDAALPRGVKSTNPDNPAVAKARAVAAIAIVRSGDTLPLKRQPVPRSIGAKGAKSAKSAKPKQNNLVWALGELIGYAETAKNSPIAVSWRAEAQIAGGIIDPAFKALDGLAKADLMPDAHGWLALAKIRTSKADTSGAATALTRCKAMAVDATVCTIGPGLGGS